MNVFDLARVLAVWGLLMAMFPAAAVTRADVDAWLAQAVVSDPPAAGSVLGEADLARLAPWIPPGYADEFAFPGVRITI
tara:strand:- start:2516 stop:2752 length:237 start_codon:yes stop_codon:yes gene_type:complete